MNIRYADRHSLTVELRSLALFFPATAVYLWSHSVISDAAAETDAACVGVGNSTGYFYERLLMRSIHIPLGSWDSINSSVLVFTAFSDIRRTVWWQMPSFVRLSISA